jgi:hypothetical protein
MIYTLTVILVLIGAAASGILVIACGTWARRLGADGDSDKGKVKAASVFHSNDTFRLDSWHGMERTNEEANSRLVLSFCLGA